jgi:hypothetical protein
MDPAYQAKELAKMRHKMAWYLSQAEEYDSGRPEAKTDNGIVAAMRCTEMAAKYRGWAHDLSVIIDAHGGL